MRAFKIKSNCLLWRRQAREAKWIYFLLSSLKVNALRGSRKNDATMIDICPLEKRASIDRVRTYKKKYDRRFSPVVSSFALEF